jgi:hypothetical protein
MLGPSDAELVEAIAQRVVELIAPTPQPDGLVDAATVAAKLGVSKAAVWRNAEQLGGIRIGSGPRGRWRFDLAKATTAHVQAPVSVQAPRRSPRRTDAPLLPIKP